jgi:two-component system, sensor histidine kinase and response regulator
MAISRPGARPSRLVQAEKKKPVRPAARVSGVVVRIRAFLGGIEAAWHSLRPSPAGHSSPKLVESLTGTSDNPGQPRAHPDQAPRKKSADRARAEQAIRQLHIQNKLILDAAGEGIYGLDLEGNCTFVNPAGARMLGWSAEEVVGQPLHSLIHHTKSDGTPYLSEDCPMYAAYKDGTVHRVNNEVLWRKDGSSFPVGYISTPILDESSRPIGAVVIFDDITERKRAEHELAHERRLFQALMDNIPDTIYFQDTQCRFMRINKAQADMLGIADPQEAVGKTDFDFFPPEFAQACYEAEQKLLESGQPMIDVEQKLTRPTGHVQWLSSTEVPIRDVEGKIMGYVGISRDITDRKLAEIELANATRAAESANRVKSEFLANMSHEIRTPINGVIGMTELVLDTELSPEQREYLETIRSSAETLLTVINDILDFSKIEAGKLGLDSIPFALRDGVEETTRTIAFRAHQKGLELTCDIRPEVPEQILGDPTRLRQILVNLASNAIKFTEQGEVALQVEVESQSGDSVMLHFSVRDTGMGIPVEKHGLIFEAFSQADTSTSRRFGGTGLGLTICSRLVSLMNGRMWLESAVGQGSTFHFTAQVGIAERQPERRRTEPRLEGMAALVVDDNVTNRRILAETLGLWGIRVTEAESAAAALTALAEAEKKYDPFVLLLTDVQMPERDGFELVEEVKRRTDPAHTPVVVMLTSAGARGDAVRCRQLGVAGYVTKPIRQSDLHKVLTIALSESTLHSGAPELVTRHSLREAGVWKSLNVLLAEDNLVNQKLAARLLEKQGHKVTLASNGKEALALLDEQVFDLVLMDVQMPELDGFETTAAIREREQLTGKHQVVVAMTAHAMKGDRERCLDAGMDGYVSKPIHARELLAAIDEALSSSSVPATG